jgi:aryl-alcohol dehydrogenase-like predicted oxidoreductase
MQSSATPLCEGIPGRLVLGGHSFISQLGNDPPASEEEQIAIVDACLDAGIRRFDTTYQPERKALGRMLEALGRRHEAKVFAWNFFTDFAAGEPVGKPEPFQPHHMDIILDQLRSSHVDCLVVIPQEDETLNHRQAELVTEWRRRGYARSLGLWVEDTSMTRCYQASGQFDVAIRPFNVTTKADAIDDLTRFGRLGWETLVTSPFFRGWELDRIAAASVSRRGDPDVLRATLASLMLRHALFQSHADGVVVAMRQVRWIKRNLESVAKGPLTARERQELRKMCRLAEQRWWQRLRRPGQMLTKLARQAGRR